MKEKKIAVVMGGPSTEREVSLRTGNAILTALQRLGYQAVGIDLEPARIEKQLADCGAEVVFVAVHGKYGEDGTLQGLLELKQLPYTGSGVLASALAMDKVASKMMFQGADVPTPRFAVLQEQEDKAALGQAVIKQFGLPVVIKSAAQGSSIGVCMVHKAEDVQAALEEVFRYGKTALLEECIIGREITVPVWCDTAGAEAMPVIEIAPKSGVYDYQSKYTKGASEYIVPAQLPPHVTLMVQQAAVQACQVLGCFGVARADIMLDEKLRPYVLEVNTVPGMTETSLVPKAAAAEGHSFEALCERILLQALTRK